jgi:membrane-associated protease RseP (regulator of RpoE activity)
MNQRILAVLLAAILAVPVVGIAAEGAAPPAVVPQTQTQAASGYLGVLLGPVPGSVRAQLGNLLPRGQGVMIRDVVADSPAAKAGLDPYDIIVGYNDQKLFSIEQLTQLVRAETPGTSVTLNVVHNGTLSQTRIALGQAPVETGDNGKPETGKPVCHHYRHHHRHTRAGPPGMMPPGQAEERNWESFDSMSLKKLDDGTFKAEIRFLGDDGKLVKKEFSGSRTAIRHQLLSQRDLPRAERLQLLDALSTRDRFIMPPPEWPEWYQPSFYAPQWWYNQEPDY